MIELVLFVILQLAIIIGLVYGAKLIIKIVKDKKPSNKVFRIALPVFGMMILLFYFVKHILEFSSL